MTTELTQIIQEVAKNSPLAAIAIVAIFIVYRLAEQKIKMALDMAEQHKQIAAQYQELCDSSQTWGQQWILALERNTSAFTSMMKLMDETKDVVGGVKEVLPLKEKRTVRKAA